ncbi:MAG: hypothetical protein RLZZ623_3680 [Actinomycetota bacterium]
MRPGEVTERLTRSRVIPGAAQVVASRRAAMGRFLRSGTVPTLRSNIADIGAQVAMPSMAVASTKLSIPRPPSTNVARPSLTARLDEPSWRLGVVLAPAGFGKTTLLSAWSLDREDRPAWFSCDSSDAEPVRFWSGLIESIGTRWSGVGDDARMALRRSGAADRDIVVSLANDLAEVESGSLIVLDDLHHAGSSAALLATFIAALPPPVRLLVASRRQPAFSLTRLRLAGDLLEIRTDELRFSGIEATAMLVHLPDGATPADVGRLNELTEGWPAALQLAAMSLARTSDRDSFLDALASTEGALADYLINEVLAGLPDDWVEFLLATSVLDEFDADLCQSITGRSDVRSLLHELIGAGLFVIPLDETGQWYRYHHLFAAMMQARLRAKSPGRLEQIHVAAARDLERRGMAVRAMGHALAIGDHEMAGLIARRAFGATMYPVDAEVSAAAIRLWLRDCGRQMVATDPAAVLEYVALLQASAASDDVSGWLDLIGGANPTPSSDVTALIEGIWADRLLGKGQIDEAVRRCDLATAVLDDTPSVRPLLKLVHSVSIRAHLSAGNVDFARGALDRISTHPLGHPILDEVRLPGLRAWVAYLDGDLTLAKRLAEASARRSTEIGVGLSQNEPGRIMAGAALAGVMAERMDNDGAVEALTRVSHIAEIAGRPWYQCVVRLQQAAVARLMGDSAAARTHLDIARSTMLGASAEVEATFALEAAQQAVRFEPWTAAALVEKLGDGDAANALRIRLLLERGEQRLAAALISSLPTPTTTRQAVEYGMLRAMTLRDTDAALVAVEATLDIAASEDYVRTIIEAGPLAPELLAAVPIRAVNQAYLGRLLAAATARIPPARTGVAERLIDPLSDRELVVLRYLSSRLTNPEIAASLYISVNTLKSHVKTVYRKLDASSRAEAVDAGRRKRLI